MEEYPNIKELLLALSWCKKEIKGFVKDGKNPHYNSNYSTLDSVLTAIKEPLNKWGLLIIQKPSFHEGANYIFTDLIHVETGENLRFNTPLILSRQDSQAYGSALTYARRYALVSLFSIPQTDDDGNTACSITSEQKLELEMLLNGNTDLKERIFKAYKIKDIGQLKYASFESIKNKIVERLKSEVTHD